MKIKDLSDKLVISIDSQQICSLSPSAGSETYFFLENALKKSTEYFLKFLFLFESTILPVNSGK